MDTKAHESYVGEIESQSDAPPAFDVASTRRQRAEVNEAVRPVQIEMDVTSDIARATARSVAAWLAPRIVTGAIANANNLAVEPTDTDVEGAEAALFEMGIFDAVSTRVEDGASALLSHGDADASDGDDSVEHASLKIAGATLKKADSLAADITALIAKHVTDSAEHRRSYMPNVDLATELRQDRASIERLVAGKLTMVLETDLQEHYVEKVREVLAWAYDRMEAKQLSDYFFKPPYTPQEASRAYGEVRLLANLLAQEYLIESQERELDRRLAQWCDAYGKPQDVEYSAEAVELAWQEKYATSMDQMLPSLEARFATLANLKQREAQVHEKYPDVQLRLARVDYNRLAELMPPYGRRAWSANSIVNQWGSGLATKELFPGCETGVNGDLLDLLSENQRLYGTMGMNYLRSPYGRLTAHQTTFQSYGMSLMAAENLYARQDLMQMTQETGVNCMAADLTLGLAWLEQHPDKVNDGDAIGFPANISTSEKERYTGVNVTKVHPDNAQNQQQRLQFGVWDVWGAPNCVLVISH